MANNSFSRWLNPQHVSLEESEEVTTTTTTTEETSAGDEETTSTTTTTEETVVPEEGEEATEEVTEEVPAGEGVTVATDVPAADDAQAGHVEGDVAVLSGQLEGEKLASKIDTMEESQAALESMYGLMEASLEDYGMSPQAVRFQQLSMARVKRELGINTPDVSVEAFGGSATRMEATMESMEGAKKLASRIWQAIKNAFIQLARWIGEQYTRWLTAAGRAKARAGKLKAAINAATGTVPADAELNVGNRPYLFIGGTFATDAAGILGKVTTGLTQTYPTNVTSFLQLCNNMRTKGGDVTGDVVMAITDLANRIPTFIGMTKTGEEGDLAKYKSEMLPGSVHFNANVPTKGEAASVIAAFTSGLKVAVATDAEARKKTPKDHKVKPRGRNVTTQQLGLIETALTSISANPGMKKMIDELNTIAKDNATPAADADEGAKKSHDTLAKVIMASRKLAGPNMAAAQSYLISAFNAQLDLAAMEIKAMTGKSTEVAAASE